MVLISDIEASLSEFQQSRQLKESKGKAEFVDTTTNAKLKVWLL
jgi:lipocalin